MKLRTAKSIVSFKPSGKHLIGNDLIFQYNTDPKHTANAVIVYLDRKKPQGETISHAQTSTET